MRFIRLLVRLSVWLTALFACLILLDSNNQFILFLSNVRWLILLPGLILVSFLWSTRPVSRWTILFALILSGFPWPLVFPPDYCIAKDKSPESTLKIMTMNLAGSADVPGRDLRALAEKEKVEILALQEVTPGFWRTEGKRLRKTLPFYVYQESEDGYWTQALLSRRPVVSYQIRDPGPGFSPFDARIALDVTVQNNRGPYSVLVMHLTVPFYRGDCRGVACLLWRYDQTDRDLQLQEVQHWLDQKEGPAFVLGDLNLSDQNPIYPKFSMGMVDAGRCSINWPKPWPADGMFPFSIARIDYALAKESDSERIMARSRTIQIPGTDHRALIAEFVITAASRPGHNTPAR